MKIDVKKCGQCKKVNLG